MSIPKQAVLSQPSCAICGQEAATAHHILKRSQGGDDSLSNLVALCGSGTTGCHGKIENNDHDSLQTLGYYLLGRRPDVIRYLDCKRPKEGGASYIMRRYIRRPTAAVTSDA